MMGERELGADYHDHHHTIILHKRKFSFFPDLDDDRDNLDDNWSS